MPADIFRMRKGGHLMTLQQLRYFCVMSNVLHYTRAAEQLYISQPSLSYALSELEKELGVPLFEKRKRKTHLSQYGEAFLPYAKSALDTLAQGQSKILKMSSPLDGNINFGYIYSASSELPEFVESFRIQEDAQSVSFFFQQSTMDVLMDRLLNGTLDLLLAVKPDIAQVDYLPIYKQELFLIVFPDHPLASKEFVTLDDIKDEKFILVSQKNILRRQLQEQFVDAKFVPQILFEIDECNSIAAFVNAHVGITIMPRTPLMQNYDLRMIPFADGGLYRDICLLWDKDRKPMPSVQRFIDFARNRQPQEKN